MPSQLPAAPDAPASARVPAVPDAPDAAPRPQVETERMIQHARVAALVLAGGLAISFGSDRSLGITLAVALLAATVVGTEVVLRRTRSHRTMTLTGWLGFAADAAVCATALTAVSDDPIDPIGGITVIVAIEAAVRWGARGAVLGGLLAGGMAVAWAASGYAAIGRHLPAASIAFRLLYVVVVALPVGLLIERLRRQQEHTHRLFESSSDAIVVMTDGTIASVNPEAARLAGTAPSELRGRPFGETFGQLFEIPRVDGLLARAGDEAQRVMVDDSGPGGRWMEVRAERSADGRLVFVIARDVTQQRIREEDLRFRAWHDHLTGLPNRAALRSRLAGRLGEEAHVGVVFIDLDGFKAVNDGHGHLAGDHLLVETAQRLERLTRTTDAAYRWAGDEFVIVVDPADPDTLLRICDRITEAFTSGFATGDAVVRIRPSIGAAMSEPGDTEDILIGRADAAMYRDKQQTRPRLFPLDSQ